MSLKPRIVPGIKREITDWKYQKEERREGGREEKALFGEPPDKTKAPSYGHYMSHSKRNNTITMKPREVSKVHFAV